MVELHSIQQIVCFKFMISSFLKDGIQAEAYRSGKAIFFEVIEFAIVLPLLTLSQCNIRSKLFWKFYMKA